MQAVEITEPGVVQLVEKPMPKPRDGEVLVRVDTIGFCGTDLSTFRGRNPLVSYPRVPGHEAAVVVQEDAGGWTSGDRAYVFPYTECGRCSSCLAKRPNCCRDNQTLGVQRDGVMQEYAAIPADKLISADQLSTRELALVEPLSVGAHAAARGQVQSGETVVVLGCGVIGLGAVAAASWAGARVIAVDLDDRKLKIAEACGAALVVNSLQEDLAKRLEEETEGHGPAVVIEAVGIPATFRAAVDMVSFAGRVVYIGYAKEPVEYDTKWFVMKELDIRGSRNALRGNFEEVVRMMQGGNVPSDLIVTQVCDLPSAPEALVKWSKDPGIVTKIHLCMQA